MTVVLPLPPCHRTTRVSVPLQVTGSGARFQADSLPPRQPRLVPGRLEQLDGIAGWILEEDLLAAGAGDDVVPEVGAACPQRLDEGREVGHLDREAVPSSRCRDGPVRHRLTPASTT